MKHTPQHADLLTPAEPSRFAAQQDVLQPTLEKAGHSVAPVTVAEHQQEERGQAGILAPPRQLVGGSAQALWGPLLVVAYLLVAYAAVYQVLPSRVSAGMWLYVAQPLIWSGLGLLAYGLWRQLPDRPAFSKTLVGLSVVAGVFHISLLVIAGLLYGFGNSPYGDQTLSIAKNALYLTTFLLGLEMSRAYLLIAWSRINPLAAFAVVASLYTAVAVPINEYRQIGGREETFEVFGVTVLPGASESVMATFLAAMGGPLPAFAYRFTVEGFEWFSPILPNFNWPIAAFLGTLAPLLAVLIVRDIYFSGEDSDEETSEDHGIGFSPLMLIVGIAVVGLIWLNAGMFGVQPALVSGVSMKPELAPGDIVFTKQVEPESLEVGDVIRFEMAGLHIMHRIVEIPENVDGQYFSSENEVYQVPEGSRGPIFITQGDNNNVADEPISAEQIIGKVVYTVREVGWVPIWIKRAIELGR